MDESVEEVEGTKVDPTLIAGDGNVPFHPRMSDPPIWVMVVRMTAVVFGVIGVVRRI